MNRSVLLIMGGAVIAAVLVAVIVQANISKKDVATKAPTTEILVAAKKLLTGERVKAESVRWQAWPDAALYKGVIKKADETDLTKLSVYDTPLRRDIESGEPIVTQAIIADVKGGGNFLAASIGEGMRAMAASVKADTGVGGFVSPGDRVDVILTYAVKISSDAKEVASALVDRLSSQTVLSNIRVLAVDQDSKDEGRAAKIAKTVTLEVDKEQAEVLALAMKMGDIRLSLRRLGEKDEQVGGGATPVTTDVRTSEVMSLLVEVMQKANTQAGAVRVYSGNSVQNVPVRSGGGE